MTASVTEVAVKVVDVEPARAQGQGCSISLSWEQAERTGSLKLRRRKTASGFIDDICHDDLRRPSYKASSELGLCRTSASLIGVDSLDRLTPFVKPLNRPGGGRWQSSTGPSAEVRSEQILSRDSPGHSLSVCQFSPAPECPLSRSGPRRGGPWAVLEWHRSRGGKKGASGQSEEEMGEHADSTW